MYFRHKKLKKAQKKPSIFNELRVVSMQNILNFEDLALQIRFLLTLVY